MLAKSPILIADSELDIPTIHKAFDLRQMGDYRELINLDQKQSDEVLDSADQFAQVVEKYLSSPDL